MPSYHKKSELKPLSEAMKGYLAGLIDGEGYIVISHCKRYLNSTNCWVGIENTSLELMKWLIENVGGKMYHKTQKSFVVFDGKVCQRQPCYKWIICATNEINDLLKQIISFLVIKKDKAQQCIDLTDSKIQIFQERQKYYRYKGKNLIGKEKRREP